MFFGRETPLYAVAVQLPVSVNVAEVLRLQSTVRIAKSVVEVHTLQANSLEVL